MPNGDIKTKVKTKISTKTMILVAVGLIIYGAAFAATILSLPQSNDNIPPSQPSSACTSSANLNSGTNYYVASTVSQNGVVVPDVCAKDQNGWPIGTEISSSQGTVILGSNDVLKYMCFPNGWQGNGSACSNPDGCADRIVYTCPNGCENGACIPNACVDSDGENFYTAGIVSGPSATLQHDTCAKDQATTGYPLGQQIQTEQGPHVVGANDVFEYVCRPNGWNGGQTGQSHCSVPTGCENWVIYTCPNGCQDGTCICPDGNCFQCTGETPSNMILCPGDYYGLTANTAKLIVNKCTDTRKCEYTCSPGYALSSDGVCIQCAQANQPPASGQSCCPGLGLILQGNLCVICAQAGLSGNCCPDLIKNSAGVCACKPGLTLTSAGCMGRPSISFSVSPTRINSGGSATLKWSASNATSCIASNGWSGEQGIQGSKTVSPKITTKYSLTCKGLVGSGSISATVTVK